MYSISFFDSQSCLQILLERCPKCLEDVYIDNNCESKSVRSTRSGRSSPSFKSSPAPATQRIQERLTIHLLMRWVRFIGEEQMINKILSWTMSDLCIAMHRLLWEHNNYIHTSSPIPVTLFLMYWTQVTRHLRVWFWVYRQLCLANASQLSCSLVNACLVCGICWKLSKQ